MFAYNIQRMLLLCLLGALLLLAQASFASLHAEETGGEILLAGAEPLSSGDMGEMRGGFMDPSGLFLSFAVDVRTLVDGSLLFVRSFVLQTDTNGQIQASTNSNLVSQNLPNGMVATLVDNGKALAITDQQGNTTAINQTAKGTFANIILNTASNRDVTQTMDISLVLKNVQNVTGAVLSSLPRGAGSSALAQTARAASSGLRF